MQLRNWYTNFHPISLYICLSHADGVACLVRFLCRACMHETQLLQAQIRELHEALQKEAQKMADLEEERMQLQHQLQGVTRFVKVRSCVGLFTYNK